MGSPVFLMLTDAESAHAELTRIWRNYLKPLLLVGRRFEMEIRDERRTSEQNAKFHAICEDLERAGVHWNGRPCDAHDWKILLVSGHAIATKTGGSEIVTGLEGELVNLRESTANMSKSRGSSLIEYSLAFLANHTPHEGA